MSHGKEITLYTHLGGPNGWKVAFFLAELGITYESIYLDFNKLEQKAPEFIKLNPNGRIPAIIDHRNNDFVLWESGAILLYLADRYDKEHKFSAVTDAEKAFQNQWLFFQASGQGPYFGQFFWFKLHHAEQVATAIERYEKEIERVLVVLNDVLSNQDWLVGNKMTIADISFISWNNLAFSATLASYNPVADKFPAVYKWHTALTSRPAVKATLDERAALRKK